MSWVINIINAILNFLRRYKPEVHHITFDGNLGGTGMPMVSCTCGWVVGPTRFCYLVNEAKEHAAKTGHIYPSYDERLNV